MAVLVCVVGDKGGIGKSTWARGFADALRQHAIPAALFDGDWMARSLFRPFCARGADGEVVPLARQDPRTGCILYDIHHRQLGRDLLLNSLSVPGVDVILHDLPAGFRAHFTDLMGVARPEEALEEFVLSCRSVRVRPVFVTVITPHVAGHQGAPWLAETLSRKADVVAVRNQLHGDDLFGLWRARDQERFARAGGIEISMPALDGEAFLYCDSHALRFSEAAGRESLALADRLRVASWKRRFDAELSRLGDILPLSRLPAVAPAEPAATAVIV